MLPDTRLSTGPDTGPGSAPVEGDAAIRAVNLSMVYRGVVYGAADAGLAIFTGLNLEVARGERLALVGESGAGKSTLLHLLGGLDRPTEGEIYFGQKDICKALGIRLGGISQP